MLPQNTVIPYDDGKAFLVPKADSPLTDYEYGGIAIGDTSKGMMYQIWKLVYGAGNFRVVDLLGNSVLVHTVSGYVTQVSLAFDQNMRPTIAYVEDDIVKLYWFDSSVGHNVISSFPSYRSPRVSLDDGRAFNIPESDIIFVFIEDNQLKYKVQRERYSTAYTITAVDADETISQVGMDKGFRFKFELELIEEPDEQRPTLKRTVEYMDIFNPVYWRVDGQQTASFSITNYQDGFEVNFINRMKSDLVGIIWDSKDTKDHLYLGYEEKTDYRDVVWSFNIELSDNMPMLDEETLAPTLTVNYIEGGQEKVAFIALFQYADNPHSRNARITIDWSTVKAGFEADEDFPKDNIKQIFFAGVTSNYDGQSSDPLDATEPAYLRLTGSQVSGGSMIALKRVIVPEHAVGMCTSYDDHYDLNPQRLVENMHVLGYRGQVNHYCGMSKYPVINWDVGLNKFQIPDTMVTGETVVSPPCIKWHTEYARLLHQKNMSPIYSVSWELYSLGAREEWCQREFNDRIGKTGYTPPSYFMSMCHENAIAYIHKAYREFADCLVAGGADVVMQIGEPWWWFNTDSLNPCVYDYQTRLAFNADTGLFAPDLGTIYEAVGKTGTPYDEFKLWLRNKLGQTCQDIRTMLKAAYGESTQVCPLIFFPSIRTHQVSLATYINYPQEHYAYPNFDFVMTEAYDWIIEQPPRLDLSHQAVGEIPIGELGYAPQDVMYLSGFVPDAAIAYIYHFDKDKPYQSHIWQRIFGDIRNNDIVGIRKQFVWAYPQVMAQSITIDSSVPQSGFFFRDQFTKAIRDNTPYPDDIFLN